MAWTPRLESLDTGARAMRLKLDFCGPSFEAKYFLNLDIPRSSREDAAMVTLAGLDPGTM